MCAPGGGGGDGVGGYEGRREWERSQDRSYQRPAGQLQEVVGWGEGDQAGGGACGVVVVVLAVLVVVATKEGGSGRGARTEAISGQLVSLFWGRGGTCVRGGGVTAMGAAESAVVATTWGKVLVTLRALGAEAELGQELLATSASVSLYWVVSSVQSVNLSALLASSRIFPLRDVSYHCCWWWCCCC